MNASSSSCPCLLWRLLTNTSDIEYSFLSFTTLLPTSSETVFRDQTKSGVWKHGAKASDLPCLNPILLECVVASFSINARMSFFATTLSICVGTVLDFKEKFVAPFTDQFIPGSSFLADSSNNPEVI